MGLQARVGPRRATHPLHGMRRRAGISRPEVVFSLSLILLAASCGWPGWVLWKRQQRLSYARSDLLVLVSASQRFYSDYGVWPTSHSGEKADVRYGGDIPNQETVNVLRAIDGPGNPGHATNPRKIVYLEVPPAGEGLSGADSDGNFLDPWGSPYQIIYDANLNNVCNIPNTIYNNMIGEGVVAWSCGPDRISDNADDILSWKQALPGR